MTPAKSLGASKEPIFFLVSCFIQTYQEVFLRAIAGIYILLSAVTTRSSISSYMNEGIALGGLND
jgi:hypothetical protein